MIVFVLSGGHIPAVVLSAVVKEVMSKDVCGLYSFLFIRP